jgi:hypothetical protein
MTGVCAELPARVDVKRTLRIAANDRRSFWGNRSYTLNVIGRDADEAHVPSQRPGFAPGLSLPSFAGAPHNSQLFREPLGDLGANRRHDHPGIASLVMASA